MNMQTEETERPFAFQVSANDMPHLVQRLFSSTPDPKSPVSGMIGENGEVNSEASPEIATLMDVKQVAMAMKILSSPDLIMNCRTGGGVPTSYVSACHARAVSADAYAVITPSFERAFMVTLFKDRQEFLTAWLTANASAATKTTANLISPRVRYESLIYILHAIDLYRRTTMQNLLQHNADQPLSITADEFTGSLSSSVKSGDLRWLVPCFLALTPGLGHYAFASDVTHVEELTRRDVLYVAQEDGKPTETLKFGETGRSLGVEFHRSWLSAAGFETSARTKDGWQSTGRGFLAPTGLCNHLFNVDGSATEAFVDHQALTRDGLADAMSQLLQQTSKAVSDGNDHADENAAAAVEENRGNPVPKFCSQCGNALSTGKKFCTACGAPVEVQTA